MSTTDLTIPNNIHGRVIIITGAAGGFGALIAKKSASLGARVVASDVRPEELAALVKEIRESGGEATSCVADVCDLEQMHALAAQAREEFGRIDVMVNNAGIMPLAYYSDHAQAAPAWDRCIDINLKGVLHGIISVHDTMIEQGQGHIVNLSSIYGNRPAAGGAVYGATKAAVTFLSEALRLESVGKIKVTTMRPTGVMGTGLAAGMVNPEAVSGAIADFPGFSEKVTAMMTGDASEGMTSPDSTEFFSLTPELLADQVVYAINQPWGVSIGDLTVRATGDGWAI